MVLAYMDDFLFVSFDNYSKTMALIRLILEIFHTFGISVSTEKSVLLPSREIEFLGFNISAVGTISLTPKRFAKVRKQASQVLATFKRSKRFVNYSVLRKLIGVCVSTFEAVP